MEKITLQEKLRYEILRNGFQGENMKKDICLISSSGGHWEQLKRLSFLEEEYNCIWITEKIKSMSTDRKVKYLVQQDRKKWYLIFLLLYNSLKSLYFLLKYRPAVIISTGAGVVIPFCILGKILGVKIVFIESFAKKNSPTKTGTIIYKISNKFYVQWPEMKKYYPEAEYKGAIY